MWVTVKGEEVYYSQDVECTIHFKNTTSETKTLDVNDPLFNLGQDTVKIPFPSFREPHLSEVQKGCGSLKLFRNRYQSPKKGKNVVYKGFQRGNDFWYLQEVRIVVYYYGRLMKNQSFHLSHALEVKLWNLEDVSEEREMSGSIFLNKQSAKSWEAITFQPKGCCPVKSSSTAPGIETIYSKKFTRQTKYFGG